MQEGALGTQRIVLRGQGARAAFTSNRLRAYLGAIPLTDAEGGTDLEDVDLTLLEHIDIVRGPAAGAYGSGLGGVVLMTPQFTAPQGISGNLSARYGSFNTYTLGAQVAYANSEASTARTLRVGYRRVASEGFRQNSNYRRDNLTALARLPDSDGRGSTTIQALWTGVRGEIPSSLSADALAADRTQAGGTWGRAEGYESYDRLGAGVTHQRQLWLGSQLTGSVFGSLRDAYEPRPFDILEEQTIASGGRLVLNTRLDKRVRLSAGTELLFDRYTWGTFANLFADFPEGTGSVEGMRESSFQEARSNLNAFAQADIALGTTLGFSRDRAVELSAGVGANRTSYTLTDRFNSGAASQSGDYNFGGQLNPHVSLQVAPSTSWSVFGRAARGFSPPSLAETLTPEGTPNPEIRPETGWSYELGFRGQSPAGRWWGELTAYTMTAKNLLVARRTAEDRFTGINAGSTLHRGLEMAGHVLFGDPSSVRQLDAASTRLHGKVYASYTLQAHRFQTFVDGEDDFSGNDLTGVPRHMGAVGVEATLARWSAHLGAIARGELPVDDANATFADGFTTVSARFSYVLPKLNLTISAGADNLLDAEYVSMVNVNAGSFGGRAPRYFYPGQPRTAWLGVRLSY